MLVFVHHISILNITIKLGNENNYGNLDVSVPVFVMLKGDILANPAKGAMMLEWIQIFHAELITKPLN